MMTALPESEREASPVGLVPKGQRLNAILESAGFKATTVEQRTCLYAFLLMHAQDELRARAAAPVAWRCFHCNEAFTDRDSAADHFGRSEYDKPFCQMDAGYIRWLLEQHRRNVDDDSEALRTVGGLAGTHEALRQRAEEQGYARGIADARKHPEDIGLAAPLPEGPAVAALRELAAIRDGEQFDPYNIPLGQRCAKAWDAARKALSLPAGDPR